MPVLTRPHTAAMGPPLLRERDSDADRMLQESRMAKAMPSIETGERLRGSSEMYPMAASCAASETLAWSIVVETAKNSQ
jgi:hypothetical protein